MTHDPFQTYAHYGVPSPLGVQYPSLQPSAINPVAALNAILGLSPMAQVAGMNPIQRNSPNYSPLTEPRASASGCPRSQKICA